jgi:hypothetical protein
VYVRLYEVKFYGKYIMLAGCCLFAYRRGGGVGLFAFGALYTWADSVIDQARAQIENKRLREVQVVPTEDEANDKVDTSI